MPLTRTAVLPVALLIGSLGCAASTRTGSQTSGFGAPATSGGSSVGSGATTSGQLGSNGSSGSATGSGSGGSSTGATGTGGMVVDGGYVFCTAAKASDAGPSSWRCQPGTYLCDLANPGNCFQCLNDADCANPDVPTFDPHKLYCDLDSGVPGYQNFCQQCLDDFDCTGNAGGPFCDSNPADLEGAIDTVGFEACQTYVSSTCPPGDHLAFGRCETGCASDQDCIGLFSEWQVPEAFCVGNACSACAGGACPNSVCTTDASCGHPNGTDAGPWCDAVDGTAHCICTTNSQCGGFWPICELPDGNTIGTCGCDSDAQCGVLGQRCLTPPHAFAGTFPGPYCAYPCGSSELPSCSAINATAPICDMSSGFCAPCASDLDCQTQGAQPTVGRFCRTDGACGCKTDGDCSSDAVCQGSAGRSLSGEALGACVPEVPHCTPSSCASVFCDWATGECTEPARCLSDYDCSCSPEARGRFCDTSQGDCVGCRDDLDCARLGLGQELGHCLPGGICGCSSDADCAGSPSGSVCDSNAGDSIYGSCECLSDSDCPSGQSCPTAGHGPVRCTTGCKADSDCPANSFCDPASVCRPRCDAGHGCDAARSVCDTDDVAGQNGEGRNGSLPGAVWCYACLQAGACDGGLGCGADTGYACAACGQSSDCGPGDVCLSGICQGSCDSGVCPDSTCRGPNWQGGPYDCPPGAICSNYWSSALEGVCLQNCDELPCPAGEICDVLPGLTPDHAYCFGCLQDSDCGDAGAWCDVSVNLTFRCRQ